MRTQAVLDREFTRAIDSTVCAAGARASGPNPLAHPSARTRRRNAGRSGTASVNGEVGGPERAGPFSVVRSDFRESVSESANPKGAPGEQQIDPHLRTLCISEE